MFGIGWEYAVGSVGVQPDFDGQGGQAAGVSEIGASDLGVASHEQHAANIMRRYTRSDSQMAPRVIALMPFDSSA